MTEITVSVTDWAWLLRIPLKQGDCVPLEFWFLYHYNTLLPMQRERERDDRRQHA